MKKFQRSLRLLSVAAVIMVFTTNAADRACAATIDFEPEDRIVFIGNTTAERLQLYSHFEALLLARYPSLRLNFRNLGWSGDTITLRPRPLNFGDLHTHLRNQEADVIFAFFGFGESFAGDFEGALRYATHCRRRATQAWIYRPRHSGRISVSMYLPRTLANDERRHDSDCILSLKW